MILDEGVLCDALVLCQFDFRSESERVSARPIEEGEARDFEAAGSSKSAVLVTCLLQGDNADDGGGVQAIMGRQPMGMHSLTTMTRRTRSCI